MPQGTNREEQPATWLEAATYLDSALADYREQDRREAEEQRKRAQHKHAAHRGR